MLNAIALLFVLQLAGEVSARSMGLPVPGPVIGFALLASLLTVRPDVLLKIEGTARTILAHLSLLFVPAGVGVVANIDVLADNWLPITAVLVLSTVFAMLVSVYTFLYVERLAGAQEGAQDG